MPESPSPTFRISSEVREPAGMEQPRLAGAIEQAAFEHAPFGMCVTSPDARIVQVNQTFCRIVGRSREEILTGGWAALSRADDAAVARRAMERLRLDEVPAVEFETRYVHGDGHAVWARARLSLVKDAGGQAHCIAHIEDITERRRAGAMARQSEARYRRLVDNLPDVSWTCNCFGDTCYVSPNVAAVYGYGAEEICAAGAPWWKPRIHADDEARMSEAFEALFARNLPLDVEFRARRKDESWIWVNARAMGTYEQEGMLYADGVFSDITAARTAQMRIAASLREKEALLREIHHRVKNNLQVVCSLLRLNARDLRDPEARRVLENTRNRVKAMALVHETLYRSADLAGIDFSEYLPRLAGQLLGAYGLSTRQVRMTSELDSALLPIDIAIPCALILTELISNAAKHAFAAEGTGELRVAFHRRAEAGWLLEVENSAGGAAVERAPGQGPSFGLELVRLLTEQLNGIARIERGATYRVSVEFPASGESQEK